VRIPCSLRDLQVERESLFLDFSSQRLFHRLDLFFGQRRQQFSFRAVVADAMSCNHQRQGSVHVFVDDHLASSQGGTPLGTLDLHDQIAKAYCVISIDVRSYRCVKIISRFLFRQDINAVPRCAAGTVKCWLNSAM
jgi:hypothetical protein